MPATSLLSARVQRALHALCALLVGCPALAQTQTAANSERVEEVVVTGSRILQSVAQTTQPLSVISSDQIQNTGLASVGDLLQRLTTGGSALNQKFNSSGNFGYPPDGGGIGAGSAQVSLRNLDSKRVLVLVDGLRWVNESSASGVSGSADLNTIPLSIIDHIEVLEDGASSIYGSDAIAGVVNIVTRKKLQGVEVSGYTGEFSKGGRTTEASFTVGTSGEKFSGVFVGNFYNQDEISSAKWWQSYYPEPVAGIGSGSSATPQGRATFCDPSIPVPNYGSCTASQSNFFNVTLNNGTITPVWNPANPTNPPSTYHNWSGADRFDFARLNLLLTPSQRKALWTAVNYDVTGDFQLYAKGMFNNRLSTNQAAPEPIFIGPYGGTGTLSDTTDVSRLNPYNPYGVDLCAVASPTCGVGAGNNVANFGWITRRPLEGGPRIFKQDVDTWYFSGGMKGTLHIFDGFSWDLNFVDSENKARQTFTGGYNIAKVAIALGDPSVCAAVPGCVPLDLFGGQGRPITPAMLKYISATQIDSSTQALKLLSANLTGTLFHISDRSAGVAVGVEHRLYNGIFAPDPLRSTGESQDSAAFPVSASYHVNEAYVELSLPLLRSLGASTAVRYSDYSTFGSTTTYKAGVRWQPIDDFAVRGTYSTGFRAPNLGELYGLTTFAATLVDPCGPTGSPVVYPGSKSPYVAGCLAQGVPNGFQQANTQITTFTGGNPTLKAEKSDSYTLGLVYSPSWTDRAAAGKLNIETTYYHHKVKGAIQPEDLQALLNACVLSGGVDPNLCAPFTRGGGSQLLPPKNFLQNIADITTSGTDLKVTWSSDQFSFGHLSAAVQATRVNDYSAVDKLGQVAQRAVGIEVNNSAIPRWRVNTHLDWGVGGWDLIWSTRFLSSVAEPCGNAQTNIPVPGCVDSTGAFNPALHHNLHSIAYHDIQVAWTDAFGVAGLKLDGGVNNVFGSNPPVCYSCTLNGYDAATYDLPGAFWNIRTTYRF